MGNLLNHILMKLDLIVLRHNSGAAMNKEFNQNTLNLLNKGYSYKWSVK